MVHLPLTPSERPRERLQRLGPRALSLTELVALLLGSGGRGRPVEALADQVVRSVSSESGEGFPRISVAGLTAIPGVGAASACRLIAALELGRRASALRGGPGARRIRGPEDVHRRMGPHLEALSQEEFHALYLNTQHAVIGEALVTRGILDASLIHPREVFRPAIELGAAAVILVHNHPSGDPTPSPEDRAVTRQLQAAGKMLGIPVLDHVVVGAGRWRTARAEGG